MENTTSRAADKTFSTQIRWIFICCTDRTAVGAKDQYVLHLKEEAKDSCYIDTILSKRLSKKKNSPCFLRERVSLQTRNAKQRDERHFKVPKS